MVFGNFRKKTRLLSIDKTWFLLCLVLISNAVHSQYLEETIYTSLEAFVANPSEEKLVQLQENEIEFEALVKSQDEHLALLSLQCNLGYYNHRFGKIQNAITLYEKAWETFETNQLNSYDISEILSQTSR